jgi:hypothetical protein
MSVARDTSGRDIVERFTFRANGREVADEVVIDPEAAYTQIAPAVATALRLDQSGSAGEGDDDAIAATNQAYPCVVAWTIYEAQGYRSLLKVVSRSDSARSVIGADFLTPHALRVDEPHGGLVGWAPPNAVPLTGGGYVLDAVRSEVLELNRMRFEAAYPGEMLRPHPAWRFTVPAGLKVPRVSPEPSTDEQPSASVAESTEASVRATDSVEVQRKRLCEWRGPVAVPIATLIASLDDAISIAARHTRVHPACRLYQWRQALEELAQHDQRTVAERMVRRIRENLARHRDAHDLYDDDLALTTLWDFPLRDAYRSLVEARMFVQVVTRLASHLRQMDWTKLVSGMLRAEDERESAPQPHRDHLLELYIAAVAHAAGMAVELAQGADPTANPDVIVDVAGERVGIAAKRLTSGSRALKNARKAMNQIQASSVDRGLVFLDVSNVMNRNAAAIRYVRPPEVIELPGSGTVLGHLLRFAAEHPQLERLLERPHVEGIVLRHAVPAMLAGSFTPATLETWSPIVEHPSYLTVAVLGPMLEALAPSDRHWTVGPSGYGPCEVAYVHP